MRPEFSLSLIGGLLLVAFASFGHAGGDDRQAELALIRQQAAQGDSGDELLYGLALLEGRYGLKPDAREGVAWIRRAARDGEPFAMLALGKSYAEGRGVEKDPVQAVSWWRKAAARGVAEAKYRLAQAYLAGEGVPKDPVAAGRWLREAAQEGYAPAQYLLGRMHHEGEVVEKDDAAALHWLSRAAASGYREAMDLARLVRSLVDAASPVAREYRDALRQRAEHNDPHAQYELALRYETGALDVEQDPAQALVWFRRAAREGNVLAMCRLARAWRRGELGLNPDPKKADYWEAQARAATTTAAR